MKEEMIALSFYREIMQALRATGVEKIMISINREGKLEADIVQAKKSPYGNKGSLKWGKRI